MALVLFACRYMSAQTGGIEGTVIDSLTRQPIAGAHIMLGGSSADNGMPDDVYGAMSQRDGRFSISNMKPGVYFYTVSRNGMVQMPAKGAPGSAGFSVSLKPGQQVSGYTMEMAPRALIAGRVTDEYGEPVKNLQVQATFAGPDASRAPNARGMSATTDERGQYRMTGSAGKYRIKVQNPRQMFSEQTPEVRSDGTQPGVYATTWFPATASEDQAGVVEVAAGHDATGIEVRLIRQQGLSISGIVNGLPNNTRAVLYLFPGGNDLREQLQGTRTASTALDGKFSFGGVAPGSYRLSARTFAPGTAMRSAFTDVRVDSGDATGVQLQVFPGEELSGTLEFTGGKPNEKTAVILEPLSQAETAFGAGANGSAEVDKQGAFRIASVFPGKVRVRVDPLPENAYVKTVKLDSVETADGVIDLARGVKNSTLKISVSPNGAQIDGTVVSQDRKPAEGAALFVVLAAKAEDIGFDDLKRMNPGKPFSFKGVRPGKYRLYAVDAFGAQNLLADVKGLFPKAEEIVVRESDRITKEAKVMTNAK